MIDRLLDKPIIPLIILLALSFYLFFFQSGNFALTDPDETFYAQTAKEMLARGEWVTPYLYGKPQFEKPILFYWLVEISFKIFGVNEFAARLPSAAFGLFGIIAVYLLGMLFFNKRVGVFSALILATNAEYIILSRACVTDMVLSTFILLGVLLFFYAHIEGKGFCYILSSIAFALATLTKGPIGLGLPAIIIIAYLCVTRDVEIFKKVTAIFWAIVVFLVISLPWYLVMHRLHGKDFIGVFFGFHNIIRFLEPEHEIGSQVYYYIPILFGEFFPWSTFLPFGLWHTFKETRNSKLKTQNKKRHSTFLLLWFFIIFLFFSVSRTKLPTYILPSFPALALMIALLWDDFLKGYATSQSTINKMRISYYLLLAAIIIAAIGSLILIRLKYPTALTSVLILILFLIFGIGLSLVAFIKKKYIATFFFIIYSVALSLYPLSVLIMPDVEYYETSKDIARKLSSLMKADERLGSESHYLAGLAFYTGKIPIDVDKHHILVQFLSSRERVWGVLKEKNHIQLYTLHTKPYYTRPSYMVYKVGKKCIVTNEIPDDGKYILKRERVI